MQTSGEKYPTKREGPGAGGLNWSVVSEGAGQESGSDREPEAGSHRLWKGFEVIRNVMGSPWLPNCGSTQCEEQTLGNKGWEQGDLLGNYCNSPKGRPELLGPKVATARSCKVVGFGICSGGRADQICR